MQINILENDISNGILIRHIFNDTDKISSVVVIIFTARNEPDINRLHGSEFFLSKQIDVILVNDTKNIWYQNFSNNSIKNLNSFLDKNNYLLRLSYGISMGGYAACQFSKILKIDKAIAFSPQFTIDMEEDSRHYKIANKTTFIHHINDESISPVCKYIFISDSKYHLDQLHMSLFSKTIPAINFVHYKLNYTGHSTIKFLSDLSLLKDVLNRLVYGCHLNITFIKNNKYKSLVYFRYLIDALIHKRKFKYALYYLKYAIDISDHKNPIFLKQKAIIFKLLKQYSIANELLLQCLDLDSNDPDTLIQLSIVNSFLGLRNSAIEYARKAIDIDGRDWYINHLNILLEDTVDKN